MTSRAKALLTLAAAAPFAPGAVQFARIGVPDYLFTGDAATLEIRMLHAAHGAQLLGPYSRFIWSHPGPMFFYLALPLYELAHRHGPALNLFMFLVNLACAAGVVLTARRIAGDAFAWSIGGLLALFELVTLPFVQTGEWNPVSPILPLVLLSFVAVRVALGDLGPLPLFAFLASAIVQTHVGYMPEVAALSAVALGWNAWRWRGNGENMTRRRQARNVLIAMAVLLVCWIAPLCEMVTHWPGNLGHLVAFFAAPHPPEHPWSTVLAAVSDQLARVPLSFLDAIRVHAGSPGTGVKETIAALMALSVAGVAIAAALTRDGVLGVVATVALAELVVAPPAVRAVRGEIFDYLVLWIAVPGLMAGAVVGLWAIRRVGPRGRAAACGLSLALIGLALIRPGPFAPVIRPPDRTAEQFAANIEQYVVEHRIATPTIRIPAYDAWPFAAGAVVRLRKQRIDVGVEPAWTFMFGTAPAASDDHPSLVIADRSYEDEGRAQPQLTRIADAGTVVAYIEPPRFLETHRISPPPVVQSAMGVVRDPHLVVDGEVPVEGTSWDSPASAILSSTSSSITIAVPRSVDIAGIFVSVDGDDLYALRCLARPGLVWTVGASRPGQGVLGMRTRILYADGLNTCERVAIGPLSGNGHDSIAEFGFLRR